MFLTEIKKCR